MFVDDEEDIRSSLARLLAAAFKGLEVDMAEHAMAAMDLIKARKEPYDIVISDYRMPGMDGIEFLQKCITLTPDSYRVMMTAFPDRQVSEDATELADIEAFLTKPVDPVTILVAVRDLLRQRWVDAA